MFKLLLKHLLLISYLLMMFWCLELLFLVNGDISKNCFIFFCQALGMKISDAKSILMSSRGGIALVRDISTLFNFQLKDFNEWTKYLGYSIKNNNYRVADWKCLFQKFEKRISNWSYRWLSMGGQITLTKSMIEGIPMYWLSLDHIPSYILNTLRKRMFSFLWSGNVVIHKFHLDR